MVPRRDWFTMKPPSLTHGLAHSARVMVWTTVLAGDGPLFEPALWAAACHDLCRESDDVDPGHGERAAIWVLEELPKQLEEAPEELDRIASAVRWHARSDREAGWRDELLWMLKDADGLDRVRLGDFDERYLRSDAAREQVEGAEDLYQRTRRLIDPVDVWSEAFRLGLPIDRLLDFDFGLSSEEAPTR
jgi:hypothetical protein